MGSLLKQGLQAFIHHQPTPDTDSQIVIFLLR